MSVIWKRTAAGDAELRTRAVALSAAARNLLMIVDGGKSEELFLANLVGVTEADFRRLSALGLIERKLDGQEIAGATAQAAPPAASQGRLLAEILRAVVSEHLGPSGVAVINHIDRARTIEELRQLAETAINMIRARKGDGVADDARRRLFGK